MHDKRVRQRKKLMMLRSDLEKCLNDYLNCAFFKDYCPNGLQIEGRNEIKKALTAVSANLLTLQKAVELECDALIVHHGLFWDREPQPLVGTKRKKIELLFKHGISLFAYHLPLDAHKEVGNNWYAAKELGWEDLEPFGDYNGTLIGVKGNFAPQPIETFVAELEAYYEHTATVALGGKRSVSSGALISGGAHRELSQAAKAGVDCFITGNFDEPAWAMAHEEEVHFLALGHSATEEVGPKALAHFITTKCGIECAFLHVPNPF
jgi:dinuclear metal center YbgI/SA1388 family protein